MNRFAQQGWLTPQRRLHRPATSVPNVALVAALLLCGGLAACNAPASEPAVEAEKKISAYVVNIVATPAPKNNSIHVELSVQQSTSQLLQLRMDMPDEYFSDIKADGKLERDADEVSWEPPDRGGAMSWTVTVNRRKTDRTFDAYMNEDWALFRGSDILPPAATRAMQGAISKTSLEFKLPKGWSSVTQYPGENHRYQVDNPERRFDRPTGWMLLGKIGTRTDDIAGVELKVAGPRNQGIRRMDMLSFLRWTVPEMTRVFPDFPGKLTVFIAGQPMWRGGLSAPASAYLHSSRPLISENGTSTLLHELGHIAMSASAAKGADWIIEGMAEYYSLQVLLRSGTISRERFDLALEKLDKWSKDADQLCSNRSSGAVTAKAAIVMDSLNRELRSKTDDQYSLDDVARELAAHPEKITGGDIVRISETLLARESAVLKKNNVLQCDE